MSKRVAMCAAASLLLLGCAGTVVPYGQGGVFMSQTNYGQAAAIRQANEYCQKVGRASVIERIVPDSGYEYAQAYFRCQ